MNLIFWIIVVWVVTLFATRMFDRKGNKAKTERLQKENQRQVIDATYDSVPTNCCPSCGPRLNWED